MAYSIQRVSTVYIVAIVHMWNCKVWNKKWRLEDAIEKPHVLRVHVDRDVQTIRPDFNSAEGADVNYMQQSQTRI